MVSIVTILLIVAGGYWLFFMGGIDFLKSLVGGSSQSNTKSNISSDGKSVQTITQSGMNIQGASAGQIQSKVNEMLRAQGIDMNQPNIDIQRTDSKGNKLNVQKDSRFANATSFFVNSRNNRIRAF